MGDYIYIKTRSDLEELTYEEIIHYTMSLTEDRMELYKRMRKLEKKNKKLKKKLKRLV